MQGISLIANFDVNAPFPIDSRLVVNDTTERDNIIWKYEGLKVYVLSERQSYIWQDSVWRVEYNGIYGGSGSLPGNVSVDFGSFSNTVGSASNYFQYEVDSQNSYSYLQNQFIRHTAGVSGQTDAWQGIEFRQQLKYNNGTGLKDSSYVSFNPKSVLGGISFGTGDNSINTVSERMVITGDGRVGISTNTPQSVLQIGSYSLTNELPLVFDIRTARGSSIGYNWYYTTTDQVFNKFKGSTRISSNTDGVTIFNRYSGSLPSHFTQSIHLSSVQNTWGNVGIRTTDPKGLLQIGPNSTTRKPLVFHIETNAIIGYNWYYDTVDNVFDPTKPSLNINFEQSGGLNIKTRQLNTPASSFTSSLFVSTLNRVGINNTSPQYTLDVNGVINGSSDIQAGNDVTAVRDIKAGDKVETTTGYYFKNSTVANISSANNIITFIADIGDNFTMNATQNISSKNLRVVTSNLVIASNLSPDNSRHVEGLVFEALYNGQGSGIYHYQGLQSNADMGISVLSKFGGQDRESLRISNGGKRIQIGVPSNVTTAHNLDTSSQIDTITNLHNTISDGPAPSYTNGQKFINSYSDLLHSGSYNYTQLGLFTVYQYWIRVGRVVQVYFYLTVTTFPVDLSTLHIKTPVRPISDAFGTWIGYLDSSGTPRNGFIKKSTANDWSIIIKDNSDNPINTATDISRMTGNYTLEVTI